MEKIDKTKFAEWYDTFNKWNWPDDFPVKKPLDYDDLPYYSFDKENKKTKYVAHRLYIDWCERCAGEKECMRWHHVHNLKTTNVQFEIWWVFNNINVFFQKLGFKNFYIDIYDILKVRI